MRRCAIVGDPARHSLSPAIHRAGYAAHGLDWSYEAIDVTAEDLDGVVRPKLTDPEWVGLTVTAPHKEAIMAYGEADDVTRLVGGGNTLLLGDEPKVHNTDVPGFSLAWRVHSDTVPRRAAIVGAGATARSILVSLASLGTREVTVLVRNPDRAGSLLELARNLDVDAHAQLLAEPLEHVDVLASTIPADATRTHAVRWVAAADAVFDVVYDPWPTPLGVAAQDAGRLDLNGLDLLAAQAVDQFFLMTGRKVTFEDCRSAAGQELGRRQGL